MQKLDKRIDISVEPFNVAFPSLSDISEARTMQDIKESAPNSPPYWVQHRYLVSSNISIERSTPMYRGPSMSSGEIPNSRISSNPNQFRQVIRARRDSNGVIWYLVSVSSVGQGWVPGFLVGHPDPFVESSVDGQGRTWTRVAREMANTIFMVVMASDFTDENGSSDSIRAVWGGANSRPEAVGQRQTPENFRNSIATPSVNGGGAKMVGDKMGLVDGTIVQIVQSQNPIFSPENTRNWIQVSGWSSGREVIVGYDAMDRRALAQEILDRSGIQLINISSLRQYQIDGRRTPFHNIYDTAQGLMAMTRTFYEINRDGSTPATGEPASDVFLSEHLLRAILYLNDEFGTITITAIAGLNHFGGRSDEHVRGMAVDITRISGVESTSVLSFLEGEGFITQRTRHRYLPDVAQFAGPNYLNFGSNSLHISIFGRN